MKSRIGALFEMLWTYWYVSKSSLTFFSVSPCQDAYSLAASAMTRSLPVVSASCFASSVLPVPGAPYSRHAADAFLPLERRRSMTVENRSGFISRYRRSMSSMFASLKKRSFFWMVDETMISACLDNASRDRRSFLPLNSLPNTDLLRSTWTALSSLASMHSWARRTSQE